MKRLRPLFIFLALAIALLAFLNRNYYKKEKLKKAEKIEAIEKDTIIASPNIQEIVEPIQTTTTSSINEFKAWVTLTPAESKRLIAIGLHNYRPVANNLLNGDIIITKGTTNHYIAETFVNRKMTHGLFTNGRITPKGSKYAITDDVQISEFYFHNGEIKNLPLDSALKIMQPNTIIFKGANIINYATKKAAVFIGSSEGGTSGMILPYVNNGKAKLIIPVGLEKNSSIDIDATVAIMQDNSNTGIPRLFFLPGELFTEIEAIKTFANVEVLQIGAGGVGGAEGSVTLLIYGTEAQVDKAVKTIETIQGEKPFFELD